MGLRIALVYRAFNLSGSLARTTVELARQLSGRHDVHVFSTPARTEPSLAPECTFHEVPVAAIATGRRFSARELLSFAWNAAGLVSRERFDVVHTCAPSTWVGDVLHVPGIIRGEAVDEGVPLWRLRAGMVRHPGYAARQLVEKHAMRNPGFYRFHVAAPSVRNDVVRFYGVDPARVTVVRPAVDTDRFRATRETRDAVRARLGVSNGGRFVVLFCGSDFERKGLDRAIEAVAAARSEAELIVVGGGPEPEFRRIAERLGIADRVHFFGERADAHLLYRAADVVALPTRADVWGVTPIEAMASGVPPIVSAAAGSSVAVDDGKTGIVLPEPFDVRVLRDAIDALAADPARRKAMGEAGIAASREHSSQARGELVERELTAVAAEKAAQHAS